MININLFATKLARLVNNYEALLNPKATIMNRANAYVTKNYGENVAKELMVSLELNFSLSPKREDQMDVQAAPFAAGAAGDIATGAGGGGP